MVGVVVGVLFVGLVVELVIRFVLKCVGSECCFELSVVGLGVVVLISLGLIGFMEIEFCRLLKRGGHPFDERREAVHKEQASIK